MSSADLSVSNQSEILTTYYSNDARKLRSIVRKILTRYGTIPTSEMDDYYSLANEVFTQVLPIYDAERGDFQALLYGALRHRISSYRQSLQADKRKANIGALSFEAEVTDDALTLAEIVSDGKDMETDLLESMEVNDRIQAYLNSLPKTARMIALHVMRGDSREVTMGLMGIGHAEYDRAVAYMKRHENRQLLRREMA